MPPSRRVGLAWLLLTGVVGLSQLLALILDDTPFTTLWGYLGWALLFTAPWAAAAGALAVSELLARAWPGRGALLLGGVGAVLIPGAGLLDAKLHALLRGAPLEDGFGVETFAQEALRHPLELATLSLAASLGWVALGGLRLRGPSARLEIATATAVGLTLGGLCLALHIEPSLRPFALLVALAPAWTLASRAAAWRSPTPSTGDGGRWVWRCALAALGLATSVVLALQLTPVRAAWLGYLLRSRDTPRWPRPEHLHDRRLRAEVVAELTHLGEPGFRSLLSALAPGVGEGSMSDAAEALAARGDRRAVRPLLDALNHSAPKWVKARTLLRVAPPTTGCRVRGLPCRLDHRDHHCPRPRNDDAVKTALEHLQLTPADYPWLRAALRRARARGWDYRQALAPAPTATLVSLHMQVAREAPEFAYWACPAIRELLPRAAALQLLARLALGVPWHEEANLRADHELAALRGADRPHSLWGRAWLVRDLAGAAPELRPLLRAALTDPALDARVAAEALWLAGAVVDPALAAGLVSRRDGLAPAHEPGVSTYCCPAHWRLLNRTRPDG